MRAFYLPTLVLRNKREYEYRGAHLGRVRPATNRIPRFMCKCPRKGRKKGKKGRIDFCRSAGFATRNCRFCESGDRADSPNTLENKRTSLRGESHLSFFVPRTSSTSRAIFFTARDYERHGLLCVATALYAWRNRKQISVCFWAEKWVNNAQSRLITALSCKSTLRPSR